MLKNFIWVIITLGIFIAFATIYPNVEMFLRIQMKWVALIFVAIGILAALVVCAACGSRTTAPNSAPAIGNAPAHHVVIAVVGPTHGPAEGVGSAARVAVSIAMADVREDGSRANAVDTRTVVSGRPDSVTKNYKENGWRCLTGKWSVSRIGV